MSEDRLSDRAIIHGHKKEHTDIDSVIYRLAIKKKKKTRRLDLIL